MPTNQSHTFASRTSRHTNQSLQKSVPVPTQTEIQNIFPCPLKKIKTPDTQTNPTKTVKLNSDNGLQTRLTRTPAGNSVYVAIAGEVVNRRSVLLKNFVLNGQESASNPLLHIHANRYGQFSNRKRMILPTIC
jgi:hypothetical protein